MVLMLIGGLPQNGNVEAWPPCEALSYAAQVPSLGTKMLDYSLKILPQQMVMMNLYTIPYRMWLKCLDLAPRW